MDSRNFIDGKEAIQNNCMTVTEQYSREKTVIRTIYYSDGRIVKQVACPKCGRFECDGSCEE